MTIKFTFMERMVGLLIIMSFTAILITVVAVGRGQNWFRQHHTYWAVYKEGYNLQPGVKVKLLRTDIGQVTDVSLTEANQVKVTMRILAAYSSRIRADSKAAIESPTFIGSEYINIIPGSIQEAAVLPGGQIPAKEQKKIGEYLEEFQLEHKLLILEETLENLASIVKQMERPDGPLFGTMSNLQTLTGDVIKGKGSLGRVLREDDFYKKLLKDLEAVERLLNTVQGVVATVKRPSTPVKNGDKSGPGESKDMVSQIQSLLDKLNNVAGQLEKAMNEAPEISLEARQGMREVNQILESVKKNFLIRSNLPPQPIPTSHGVEVR